ncbi:MULTISPECIES: phycocyanobilin:ferredoxin oxidoreductase [Leptolyngbya]|jgi:phycocyanobilin:ferredoxin oxidoreductase|uniref:Phycocyanobilin:ferredoxin oxidoreductase n=2 Tax=Leptolyngbya boryana TaxID=1184 RepID=A0A1Z4JG24_LEPBY|nr:MULTISPECIES: phycocyanobilin:ferredoxin oxidoreductase [Leptolyngbya]BAY55724.1 phycocyanobilin:ferredoxin oxidoreductase [Leptolyngbya boryana NIES-2135]MBD1856909.1 phycocyanobilin:ferredoxin oxidoreductase [Leptolyngbya sp. FACHB-1624]MBD2370382.1 phycocyanobilin:ferredoxin oxidoreductase [Leptolyngbya sp. FACHB-161]MBD2376726.1 phycocyanobilin:ferredoxin oxidoreductase [Leptolyngbya sp. FACHB-238]MBD2400996.1 phycocyanobilin:ferredoxin oxidoreductase [Leptolyngbya sp. FACHB-239]
MSSISNPSLRQQQHPLIRNLADAIEQIWHEHLDLSPYHLPEDLGYVEGRMEGEKLVIENKCFQTPQFRKLHLELAKLGSSLDILHCVMFPRPEYVLPMFGADLVGGKTGQVSLAIADLSALSHDRQLPLEYQTELKAVPETKFVQRRAVPEWGDIFSDFCLLVRPGSAEEENAFLDQVKAYLKIHCQRAIATAPTPERKAEILAGQHYYCSQQQKNDKTRRVLEKAFGEAWADRYITTVLFDLPE